MTTEARSPFSSFLLGTTLCVGSAFLGYFAGIYSSNQAEYIPAMLGIAGTIAGAMIGAFAVFGTVRWNHLRQDARDQQEKRMFLSAVKTELQQVLRSYQRAVGYQLEWDTPGLSIDFHYPVTSGSFTVFTAHAQTLGLLKDDALRGHIIVGYIAFRGLLELQQLNNDYVRKLEALQLAQYSADREVSQDEFDTIYDSLKRHCQQLQAQYEETKQAVTDVSSIIDEVLSSKKRIKAA